MTAHEYRWILLQLSEGERLYRVRMSQDGCISLPDVGVVRVTRSPKGMYSFQSAQGEISGDLFAEGEILSRTAPVARPKRASYRRHGKLPMALALVTGLILLTKFIPAGAAVPPPAKQINVAVAPALTKSVKTAPKEIARPRSQKVASVAADVSAFVMTPKVVPTVDVSPKVVAAPSTPLKAKKIASKIAPRRNDIPWSSVEKEARGAFQHGDFAKAEGVLIGLPMKKSEGTPDRVRALASEIQYAKCQLSFNKERFEAASKACGKATEIYRNARAFALLRQLSERARRLYLEGYVMEGTNREAAIRRYREVLASAPGKDPFRAKAAKKLRVIDAHRDD